MTEPSPAFDQVVVRQATLADAERIGEMLAGIIRDHRQEPPPAPALAEAARRILGLDHASFLVAERGGEVIGMVQITERFSTWRARPFFYLDDFYVEPARRSQGIGAALLSEVVRRARARDCVRIDLDCDRALTRTVAFYLRHGFQDSGSDLLRLTL